MTQFDEESEYWRIDLGREEVFHCLEKSLGRVLPMCLLQLYLMILLHFPKEGIEHRELMALMRGATINKNYFDEEMWKPSEFESVHISA